MDDAQEYGDLEYGGLKPVEVLKKAQTEIAIIKSIQTQIDEGLKRIDELDGWREDEGPDEKRRGPRNDYLVQLLREMQKLHAKAIERLEGLIREAPEKLEDYHIAGLLDIAQEAEAHRVDLHSTVLDMHVRPVSEVDEFLGICEASLQYHTVQRIARRLQGEVGRKIDTSPLLERKDGHLVMNAPEKWVTVGDIALCREPLQMRVKDTAYPYLQEKKVIDEDKKRRRAIKVLALFFPRMNGMSPEQRDTLGLARALRIKPPSVKKYLNDARNFLKYAGSTWDISDGRSNETYSLILRVDQGGRPKAAQR